MKFFIDIKPLVLSVLSARCSAGVCSHVFSLFYNSFLPTKLFQFRPLATKTGIQIDLQQERLTSAFPLSAEFLCLSCYRGRCFLTIQHSRILEKSRIMDVQDA